MELLKQAFSLDITKEFISICEVINAENPHIINNGIGVNFSGNEIESIKLYYGFHHQLSDDNINRLHLLGSPKTFFDMQKKLLVSDYEWHPYIPTGVSFALKIDRNLNYSIGHFIMPKIEKGDRFFQLPIIKNYFDNYEEFPAFHRKGIFTIINQEGVEHQKDYYYIKNGILKDTIGKDFNLDLSIVPSIEWVIGKGFYSDSKSTDEKIVLQYNYQDVYERIIKNEPSQFIQQFNSYMFDEFNAYCVCPGYYKNDYIKSYYYFNWDFLTPTIINTIPKIQLNLFK